MDELELAGNTASRSGREPHAQVTLGEGRETGTGALTQSQIGELCAPPALEGPLRADLQNAVEGVDPLIHVGLRFSSQHEVGQVIHFQFKGVFSQSVILWYKKKEKKTPPDK